MPRGAEAVSQATFRPHFVILRYLFFADRPSSIAINKDIGNQPTTPSKHTRLQRLPPSYSIARRLVFVRGVQFFDVGS